MKFKKGYNYIVGMEFINNQGLEYRIIEDLNGKRKLIEFSKSKYRADVSVTSIKKGSVFDRTTEVYGIGKKFKTNEGYEIEIIEKAPNSRRKIMFLDEYKFICVSKVTHIRKGQIKNPYHKSMCGVGYHGSGKYKTTDKNGATIEAKTWRRMMNRAYSEAVKKRQPTYKSITVCEEWHNFQNFAEWFKNTYPYNIENVKFELDKDLKQDGVENKIYSPNTCVWIPKSVNAFIANGARKAGESGFSGVTKYGEEKWKVSTWDFETGEFVYLGLCLDIDEACKRYEDYRKKNCDFVKKYLQSLGYLPEDVVKLVR